jgi:hypothetical protein
MILAVVALIALGTAGCKQNVDTDTVQRKTGSSSEFTMVRHDTDIYNVYVLHDKKTGCEYLYVGADTIIRRYDPEGKATPACMDNEKDR